MTDDVISRAAERLLVARNGGPRLVDLPEAERPTSWAEAYAIQNELVARMGGKVTGWKVGAADTQAEPFRAALTERTILLSPAEASHAGHTVLGVEAETVYRFDKALPTRDAPYSEDEVLAAVGSVHAAIELVDTRFSAWKVAGQLSQVADQFSHSALIVGAGREAGIQVDADNQPVRLSFNGEVVVERRGGNTAGPARRLLAWMANEGTRSHGGIEAGTYITTGSWTGIIFVAPRTRIEAVFEGIGGVVVDITD